MAETNRPRIPINELDNQAPTAGSTDINVSKVTSNGFTISWEAAKDNVTAVNNIRYQVGLTDLDNPNDTWHVVRDEKGICSHTFTGLKPKTTYGFYVEAYDESGNVLSYPVDNGCMSAKTADSAPQVEEKDTEAPQTTSRVIRLTNRTSNSLTIEWQPATDNKTTSSQIQYDVYIISVKNHADYEDFCQGLDVKFSVADMVKNRPVKIKSAKGITSFTAENLEPNSPYVFFIIAKDEAGNFIFYPDDICLWNMYSQQICWTDKTKAQQEQINRQSIRDFFRAQSSGDTLKNVMVSTASTDKDTEYIVSGGQAMKLTNKHYNFTSPREEFMPIDESDIYPGRLVHVNEDLIKGRLTPVNFYGSPGAGKVIVSVNFHADKEGVPNFEKAEATPVGISTAIGNILNRLLKTGARPPVDVDSNTYISNSKEKISVDAGCSVDYMGAKCNIDITTTKNQESFYKVEKFAQGFYQVSVEPEGNDYVNYLGAGVTTKELNDLWKKGPLAVIKSVTYGRIGYNVKKYDASSFNFKGDESGSYKEMVAVSSKQDIEKSSIASSHYARIWGGSATTAGKSLQAGRSAYNEEESKKLDSDFTSEMAKNMETSMQNQGVPISFTVVFLASGKPLETMLTGSYVESSYEPLVNKLSFSIDQNANVMIANSTNVIRCAMEYQYFNTTDRVIYNHYDKWGWYEWSTKSRINKEIILPENCFFTDNKVFLKIESRNSAARDWKGCVEGFLNITGGDLKIKLKGTYYDQGVKLDEGKDDENKPYAQFM